MLDGRLDERVDEMVQNGLIKELENFHLQYNLERLKYNMWVFLLAYFLPAPVEKIFPILIKWYLHKTWRCIFMVVPQKENSDSAVVNFSFLDLPELAEIL